MSRPRAAIRTTRARRLRILALAVVLVVLAGALLWADTELHREARAAATAHASTARATGAAPSRPDASRQEFALHTAPAPSSLALLAIGAGLFGLTYARHRRNLQAG